MLSRVERFIGEHNMLPQGCRVLVGVSGGADSVALLRVLWALREKLGFTLEAAHFNHCIRTEADEDEAFVAELCASIDVPFHVGRADVPALAASRCVSLEVAARDARHGYFREIMAKRGIDRLALAHHMDDQAETVLLRLIRGTGTTGLCAMAPVEDNGIVRPFLCLGRDDIRFWCAGNNVEWREDASNADTDIPRNYIRHDLMPHIKECLNPQVSGALCRVAELMREDERYLGRLAADIANNGEIRMDGSVALPVKTLVGLPAALKSRVLRLLINRAGLMRDVERVNIDDIAGLLNCGMTGRRIDLRAGFIALREADALVIAPHLPGSPEYPFVRLNIPGVAEAAGGVFTCELLSDTSVNYRKHPDHVQYFDADIFPKDAVVRSRLPADRFHPLGAPGGKKLKEYLIDRKISRWSRDSIPVVAIGNEVLWVVGCAISDCTKVTDQTKKVLKITYITIYGKGSE